MWRVSADFEPHPDQPALRTWFEERFGLPASTFADHRFWHRVGYKPIWIAQADTVPPENARVHAIGLLAMRDPPPAKPTSVFLQRFAAAATRNVIDLDDPTAFLRGETQPTSAPWRGYVAVRWGGRVLGCGHVVDGQLLSVIPRAWARGGP